MPFQFYCPQGHLLEGQESQMGQQGQCPLCGAQFIFPMVGPTAAAPQFTPTIGPAFGPTVGPPAEQPTASVEAPVEQPQPEPEAPPEPREFRIRCPNGHELQTPSDMLGQQAMCPYCNTQFELRYEDSVEYEEEQIAARRRREEQINALWLKIAIRSAIGVALLLILGTIYVMFF